MALLDRFLGHDHSVWCGGFGRLLLDQVLHALY